MDRLPRGTDAATTPSFVPDGHCMARKSMFGHEREQGRPSLPREPATLLRPIASTIAIARQVRPPAEAGRSSSPAPMATRCPITRYCPERSVEKA